MAEVAVDLKDLELLVKRLIQSATEARAERAVRIKLLLTNPQPAQKWGALVEAAMSTARMEEEPKYRELLTSLESGENIHLALSNLVAGDRRYEGVSGT
jgi:hypothetical protein